MLNESSFSVAGYIATAPSPGETLTGLPTLSMRLAWTPRKLNRDSGNWADEPSSFATVKCYRNLAVNAFLSVHKGDPVVVTGTLRVRDYDGKDGVRRTTVDVHAISVGHDLSRGVATFQRIRPGTKHAAGDGVEIAGYPPWALQALGGQPETSRPEQNGTHEGYPAGTEADGTDLAGGELAGDGPEEAAGLDELPDAEAETSEPDAVSAPF